jgi:hypothetical protein
MWLLILTYVLGMTQIYSWCLDGNISQAYKVMKVDYSPNGNYLVAGLENQMANLYYATNRTLKCIYNAGSQPKSLKFFPTNDKFAFGG